MVNLRAVLTTILEVVGIALVAVGGWLILPAAGIAVSA